MARTVINVLLVIAAFFVARFFLDIFLAKRFLAHFGACHSELHVANRLNSSGSGPALEKLLAEYEACVRDKSNALDSLFGDEKIGETIDAIRQMKAR